jgi:alpha-glucan,water dikinase
MSKLLQKQFSAGKVHIGVDGYEEASHLVLDFRIDSDCILHWGLTSRQDPAWQAPPESAWPKPSTLFDEHAVQSVCKVAEGQACTVRIRLDLPCAWDCLRFLLYFPKEKKWLKNGRGDFRLELPRLREGPSPQQALEATTTEGDWQRRDFAIDGGDCLAVAILKYERGTRVLLASDSAGPLTLHWGLAGKFRHQWLMPPAEFRPPETVDFAKAGVRTPFYEREGLCWLELDFPPTDAKQRPRGINFLLYRPTTDQWLKVNGQDIYLPLEQGDRKEDGVFGSETVRDLAEQIIHEEMSRGSWTLMHRFNLCHDLLQGAKDDQDMLALLFVWLRFSFMRQLDWQRNYNTQPRELSHSQERLTTRLAEIYIQHDPSRPWVRLMLSTLGRGGEGQKVRDEILHIMHRNHLKEVHGHFMEEWHQKLHNNTTPDDVVICEAYLAFLNSNGNLDQFYDTLFQGGVTRERLQSFERPIRTDPEFYPDKRDALSHDFEHFLRILKSVHSGTDLDTAADAARGILDPGLNSMLNSLYEQRHHGTALRDQAETITALREGLQARIPHQGDAHAAREMLYLDLALEQLLRGSLEQARPDDADITGLTDLVWLVLRNLALNAESAEFQLCARHLRTLLGNADETREWALHAKSVTDRVGRALGYWSQGLFTRLQSKAEFMGEAFAADAWTISLFSEEIIRGSAGFLLSLLLRRLEPLLREHAGLGGWQVISPAHTAGRVQVVASLHAVQGDTFSTPTVLITDAVAGDEEIPAGVIAVITTDSPDLVSHVAVRARNTRVLFATCYDDSQFEQLKSLKGQQLTLDVSAAGDVEYQQADSTMENTATESAALTLRRRPFSSWVVAAEQFDETIVGGKSNNLQALRRHLPDWIGFPRSIALPFGVFEQTLGSPENRELAQQLASRLQQAAEDPEIHLPQVRQLLQGLAVPRPLHDALLTTWRDAGLPQMDWNLIWQTTKAVWASKWNERAWYSRSARSIDHDDLMMAVLIQQVVAADYAFVIHTVNPLNGRDDEILAEVVPGLGETLVGNYPGRALGFVCNKVDLEVRLLSYPGKSLGLYGSGVIFRSDSNGEDLERYAGAGLYDSFLAEPPQQRLLDYSDDPLVWDRDFRDKLLRSIARIGLEVERARGSAQDIEGAVQQGEYFVVQTRAQVGL